MQERKAHVVNNVSKINIRTALRDAMVESMRMDSRVILMGEDVAKYQGNFKVSLGMLDEFGPDRVIDTPISENGFAGIGIGAAMAGMLPIVEFMTMNFAMQAIDNVITAAKTRYMSGGLVSVPIVFRGPNGSGVQTAAQHSQCYASWYAHVPGLIVVAPYDANSAKVLLKEAIFDPNPVIFLEHEVSYGDSFVEEKNCDAKIGKARVLQEGTDVSLVSFSRILGDCIKAANIASGQGLSCEVIDIHTLRPLDFDTIMNSIKKTKHIVIVEEGWAFSGIAAEIIALVNEKAWHFLDAAPCRVCAHDVPMPYAKHLEKICIPSVDRILDAIHTVRA